MPWNARTWGEDPEEKEAKQNNVLKFTVGSSASRNSFRDEVQKCRDYRKHHTWPQRPALHSDPWPITV